MVDSGLITVDIDQTILPTSIHYQSIINSLSIHYYQSIINPLSSNDLSGNSFHFDPGSPFFWVNFCLRICKAQGCPLTPEQRKQYDAELQKVG